MNRVMHETHKRPASVTTFFAALPLRPLALALLLMAAFGLNGCGKSSPSAPAGTNGTAQPTPPEIDPIRGHLNHAQPKLPTIKVWVGSEELIAEIASQRVQVATGMMFRTNMPENAAMIFIFPDAAPRNFYMRNCVVPLSAGYLTPDGTLAEIAKLDPGDEIGVPSKSSNIQFVLEVPQGWFQRHNISTGAVVRTERGSLAETFFRR